MENPLDFRKQLLFPFKVLLGVFSSSGNMVFWQPLKFHSHLIQFVEWSEGTSLQLPLIE